MLSSRSLKLILDKLKDTYDYVIIDSAPVLLSTDAELASGLVDQVIMIVERKKTPTKILKKSAEILRQYSAETPYVILNKADFVPQRAKKKAA